MSAYVCCLSSDEKIIAHSCDTFDLYSLLLHLKEAFT
jgi:hypothetical protein